MSDTLALMPPPPIPAHVPTELVRQFDFRSGLADRPHEVVGALANGPRIFYTPVSSNTLLSGSGAWVLARAADIRAVFADTETFSSLNYVSMSPLIGESWQLLPLECDPPDHRRYRAALNPFFSPRPMRELAASIHQRAAALIQGFADAGKCEFVEDFSKAFPTGVFLDLMGLPAEEQPLFLEWERMIIHGRDLEERRTGVQALRDYMADAIAARQRSPREDIISHLIVADGEGGRFDDQELLGMCILLYAAGLDTVPSSLTAQFRHIAEHPDQQATLRSNSAAIPTAVEELLRLYSPLSPFRRVTREVRFAGVDMQPGDWVVLSTTIGSRDGEEYPSPETADLGRTSGARHLAFGFGIHHCLGANLARLELAAAWEEWFRVIPEPFRVAEGAQITGHGGAVLAIDRLPLIWKS